MNERRYLAVVVALLLLATALRFHRLEAQSFWNDEGNSARLSERSIPAILEGTASDIHPPLYYLLLRGWRELVGETEFGLRSLSAFAGILTVAVTGALVRKGPGSRFQVPGKERSFLEPGTWNLAPILLVAVSPVLVYYSQETRMYALLALLAALSTWALLNWLKMGRLNAWAVAYVLLLAAGFYTHYFFPAVVAGQAGVVGLHWLWRIRAAMPTESASSDADGRVMRERASEDAHSVEVRGTPWLVPLIWVGLVAAAVLLYLPWVPIFIAQMGSRGNASAGPLAFLADSGRWLVLGNTVAVGEAAWAVWAALGLVVLGVATGRRPSAVPLLLAVVPLVLMYIVGATDPAFFKFLLAVAPFVYLIMGLGWRLPRRWLALPALLTALVLLGSVLSLRNLYTDPTFARADYRAIVARIAAEAHPNAGIILNAPNQWEVFTYYHRDGAPVYPLPLGRPDPAILEPELARIAATHDRLYVLYWGDAQRDPARVVEGWLDAHTFRASEEWVGDVRLVVYAAPRAMPDAPTPSGARFQAVDGETIALREYTVWPVEARPGDVVQARLVWSADATPARPYKVFLHLLGDGAQPVAQRDGEPGGGLRPTTTWAAGEAVVDNHGLLLPGDLPPGEYTLRLGLYDAFDPAVRLPVEGGDSLLLATITVR